VSALSAAISVERSFAPKINLKSSDPKLHFTFFSEIKKKQQNGEFPVLGKSDTFEKNNIRKFESQSSTRGLTPIAKLL